MTLLHRKRIILAKIESVYGTDPVPAGADAMLVSGLDITPLDAETVSRDNIKPYLGRDLEIHVGEKVSVQFAVEAAGTAPAYGAVLRACGLAETVNVAVDVQYDPVSAGFESCTIYFNLDGQLHTLTGCRGSVKVGMDVNQIPRFTFDMTGIYNAPASVAAVTPDFSAFQVPNPANKNHVSGFTLNGWVGVPIAFEIDLANNVVNHQTLTTSEIIITDRVPAGSLTAEAPALSAKNLFSEALANTVGAVSIQHGQVAGNIVLLDAPNAQILQPKYGELNGISTVELGLALTPSSAGDDEIKITVK